MNQTKLTKTNLKLIVLAASTVFSLAACGSGSLPSELSAPSKSSEVIPPETLVPNTPAITPLSADAAPASIQVGASTTIRGYNGSSTTYTYSLVDSAMGSLSGNIFTAGSTSGQATINVQDSKFNLVPVIVYITAAPTKEIIPPATITLYRRQMFDLTYGIQNRIVSADSVVPAGWNDEGIAWKVLRENLPGTVALRTCIAPEFPQPAYQSTDATCSGSGPGTILGYVYTEPGAGRVALTRYSTNYYSAVLKRAMTDRIAFLDPNTGPSDYQKDGIQGYVPAP